MLKDDEANFQIFRKMGSHGFNDGHEQDSGLVLLLNSRYAVELEVYQIFK